MNKEETLAGIEFRLSNLQESAERTTQIGDCRTKQYYLEQFEELKSLYLWIKGEQDGNV